MNEESAGFISGTYNIFDKVEISAGVRQSHLEYSNAYIANGWINGGPSNSPVSSSQRATTPRFTAKYKFDDSNMLYANAAKGYRIGGANSQLPNLPSNPCPPQYTSGSTPYGSDSLMELRDRQQEHLGSTERSIVAWLPTESIGIRFSNRSSWRARFT